MDPAIGKTGGCQCGAIRYELNGPAKMLYVCHCRDCQKQSSSAFGMSLIMARDDVDFTQGADRLQTWNTRGDDGRIKNCAFCPDCGSRIYHASDRDDEPVSIKAGSLDDTQWLRPIAHIWLQSAQSWLEVDHNAGPCFPGEPDDETMLAKLWQQQSVHG